MECRQSNLIWEGMGCIICDFLPVLSRCRVELNSNRVYSRPRKLHQYINWRLGYQATFYIAMSISEKIPRALRLSCQRSIIIIIIRHCFVEGSGKLNVDEEVTMLRLASGACSCGDLLVYFRPRGRFRSRGCVSLVLGSFYFSILGPRGGAQLNRWVRVPIHVRACVVYV